MLLDTLRKKLIEAVKARDTVGTDTLRFLLSGLKNTAIAKYGPAREASLTDADVLDGIRIQVKSHRESIEAFTKGKRDDLVNKEKKELAILETFLPPGLSDEELEALLQPVISSGETNFGSLMKRAMELVAGRADGGRVAALLKKNTNLKSQ